MPDPKRPASPKRPESAKRPLPAKRPQADVSLTRGEFEEVIRLAAEMAIEEPEGGALSEAELYRIAGEVGLPEKHVRSALARVRSDGVATSGWRSLFGSPWIRASRVVPGIPKQVAEEVDGLLVGGRLLEPVRKTDDLMIYWPAVDWASSVARSASLSGRRYYVAAAKKVEVQLQPVTEESTWIEIAVEPGLKGENGAGAILGGLGGGGGIGFGAGAIVATMGPLGLAVAAGVGVGAIAAGGIAWAVARSHTKQMAQVRHEIEDILDRLERGESLEPPPPSWQRWVSRHFRGVARDVLGLGSGDRS